MISPIRAPSAHDVFKAGKLVSPGLSLITSCNGRQLTWQEQQAPGLMGAFVVFRGKKLVQVTYQVLLWTDAQFQAWEPLESYLNEGMDLRPPRAMRLVDLRLAGMRIPQMALAGLSEQKHPEAGKWLYEVSFQEFARLRLFGGPVQPPRNPVEVKTAAAMARVNALDKEIDAHNAKARAGKP